MSVEINEWSIFLRFGNSRLPRSLRGSSWIEASVGRSTEGVCRGSIVNERRSRHACAKTLRLLLVLRNEGGRGEKLQGSECSWKNECKRAVRQRSLARELFVPMFTRLRLRRRCRATQTLLLSIGCHLRSCVIFFWNAVSFGDERSLTARRSFLTCDACLRKIVMDAVGCG